MLPKPHRLPSPLVRQVMRNGKRINTKELQIVFCKNSSGVSRFAFIVGTSVDKRAAARNRIKRLLRESVRHLLPSISTGLDYVLIVRSNISNLSQPVVEVLVKKIFQ